MAAYRLFLFQGILKRFYWFFLIVLLISLLDFNEPNDLKEGIYLVLFFLVCVFLDRDREKVKNCLLVFSAFSVLVLALATVEWVLVWAETSEWERRFHISWRAYPPWLFRHPHLLWHLVGLGFRYF